MWGDNYSSYYEAVVLYEVSYNTSKLYKGLLH